MPIAPPLGEKAKRLFPELPFTIEGYGSHLADIASAPLGLRASSIWNGVEKLYVMGAIRYKDGIDRERWMGFCRQYLLPEYMGGEGRFRKVENPDYEYSD